MFEIIVFQGVIVGAFCAFIAGQKGRSSLGWFVLGFFFSLIAVLALIAVPSIKETAPLVEDDKKQSSGLPLFDDVPDLTSDKYRLFLTRKYEIAKNDTLGKFVFNDKLFDTLDAALDASNEAEKNALSEAKRNRLRPAYIVTKFDVLSGAEKAGVCLGDCIIRYSGKEITCNAELSDAVSAAPMGGKSSVDVLRNGKILPVEVSSGRLGIEGKFIDLPDSDLETRMLAVAP